MVTKTNAYQLFAVPLMRWDREASIAFCGDCRQSADELKANFDFSLEPRQDSCANEILSSGGSFEKH